MEHHTPDKPRRLDRPGGSFWLGAVRDCSAGIPDDQFGEPVWAWIEPETPGALTPAGVRDTLAATLSRYKLPTVIAFADALPREDSGKIFKRRLGEPYWSSADRVI